MSAWRYVQNGQPCGPLDTAALKEMLNRGAISPDTLVWQEGMSDWVAARRLPEFAPPAPAAPPVPPVAPEQPAMPPIPPSVIIAPPAAPPPPSAGAADSDAADVEKNKVFAVLAYLGLLFLVPLLAAPHSKFARYHTNQGLVLFLASFVGIAGTTVLSIIPLLGCIIAILPLAIGVCSLVFMILGIVNAASGQCKPLPLIGQIQLIK